VILDLFAGPGGWDVGAADLGLHPVGLEIDPHAVATRYAAGHATWEQPVDLVTDEQLTALAGTVQGLIASPPCQDFSAAGKRAGIDGDRGDLMWQVPRYVEALRPRWVACEQVPPALAWYELFGHEMRAAGYSVWTGVLNAADFGVPQTRKRAFLLASLDRAVQPPEPTHAEGGQEAGMFTPELLPWVTMADALGCHYEGDQAWANTRPATTIVGSFSPEVVAAPGYRKAGDPPRQDTPGSVKITPAQAATLQGFPDGYPWTGPKTAVFQQIGNAVCPPVAAAVLGTLTA